jgi:hypothetical protein
MICGPLIASKEDILMKRETILLLNSYGGIGIDAVMDIMYKKECKITALLQRLILLNNIFSIIIITL